MLNSNPNELYPELLSTAAFNLMPGNVSGSRIQMLGSHLTQMLVLEGSTPRRCITGVEREYGKYTFKVKMPVDARIIAVVPKYAETIGRNSISSNPLSVVVYENVDTREVCILEMPQYHIKHQYFGFKYAFRRQAMAMLSKGASIPKGTVFSDSPSIDENGDYKYGIEANTLFYTLPGVIEDGFIISESFAKKLSARGYKTLDASWGRKYYPLNLYGDDNTYKPFPDIGERVRPDGLLIALRAFDELLDPVNMTPANLRKVGMLDKKIYAKANAKVVDVVTRFNPKNAVPDTPTGMEEQVRRYHEAQLQFYNTLLDIYDKMYKTSLQRREPLKISRQFHRLLNEANSFKIDTNRVKALPIVQRQPLDEWRVDITVEYNLEPTEAFKATGTAGDKGVFCQIWKDEDMPVDKHGTRADIICDGNTTLNRMNPTRMYEQYLNGTSDQLEREIRQRVSADGLSDSVVKWAWERLLRYYQITSPQMYDTITSSQYRQSPRQHVEQVLSGKPGIRLFLPTNNEAEIVETIKSLREEFPIDIGPITFRGKSGNLRTTEKPALIASMYVIMLEKTGDDWSAVSSGTLQQHGILTKLTRHDKHSRPGRASPTRSLGEDEGRLTTAVCSNNASAQTLIPQFGPTAADGLATAEMMDLANNPVSHMAAVHSIVSADRPTDIQTVVDRVKYPRGGSRSLRFVKHSLETAGIELVPDDENDQPPTIYNPTFESGQSDEDTLIDDVTEESDS